MDGVRRVRRDGLAQLGGLDCLVNNGVYQGACYPFRRGLQCGVNRIVFAPDGKPIGRVTSGTFSITFQRPIAMAYVAPGDAEPGTVVDIEIRDARVPARVVTMPFYRRSA